MIFTARSGITCATQTERGGLLQAANGKTGVQQNQFGGAYGGRIIRNKTFFFADYEGIRRTTRTLSFLTLPTLDQRNGVFKTARRSDSIKNPYTGAIYSDGVVPSARFPPSLRKFSASFRSTTSGFSITPGCRASPPPTIRRRSRRSLLLLAPHGFFRYSIASTTSGQPTIPLRWAMMPERHVNIINKQTPVVLLQRRSILHH